MKPINFIIFFICDNLNFVKVVSEHLEKKAIELLKSDYPEADIINIIMEGEQPEHVDIKLIPAKRKDLIMKLISAIWFMEDVMLTFEQVDNWLDEDTENNEIETYTEEIMGSRQGAYKAANILERWERDLTRKATHEVTRHELIETLTEAVNLNNKLFVTIDQIKNWVGRDAEKHEIETWTKKVMQGHSDAPTVENIIQLSE